MKTLKREIPAVAFCALMVLAVSIPQPASAPGSGPGQIRVLLMMGNNYGGYYHFARDIWENYGWDLTTAGLQPTLSSCGLGLPFNVDTLITQISDLSAYDCLAIMQTRAFDGNSHGDLLASSEALALVQQAVTEGLLVVAVCGGTRVLAATDVIDGLLVTGYALYSQEYIDAGGTWAGDDVPPVLDGNMLTSAHGRYYCHQIGETMRRYFASQPASRTRE
jgi:transcriptional regulator GlxA family with amidase domain